MNRTTIFILFVTVLAAPCIQSVFSQQTSTMKKTPSPVNETLVSETLNWMIGEWEGEGVQNGSTFSSYLSVISRLDGTVLQINRASPSGLKEIMLLGFDGSAKKYVGVLYDSRNHIGMFGCEIKDKNIDLLQTGLPQGVVSKRSFRMQDDRQILFAIESAEPGKELSKSVEITFAKKQ
jgi:hypothetical protein